MAFSYWFSAVLIVVASLLLDVADAQSPERLEFTRLIAHWDAYGDRDAYLRFVDDAKPEIAQVGFYGAHFWSLAHTPHGSGYPVHFPVQGLEACGTWFQELNAQLHRRRVKVVGHFNVKFLVGDPESSEGPRGFFKFYRELWDERQLGPKPVADPVELLEKNADGTPIASGNYSIGGMKEYWGCLNNPHWRAVLKAWAKQGIDRGVDGFIANYFYRHNCHCSHCTAGFKQYLSQRFTPEQLKERFAINDLAEHRFAEIVSWHNPAESTPLRREMLRFSQIANKQALDEVFVQHGRKLKPDLIVAQWNHLGDFQQISGDERCLLPAKLWGHGEDYLWYSTGDAANSTDLSAGHLGEATLQARYVRGAFQNKPFTLGKYESTRIRTAIAELAANGGAPMGFYTRFTDPAARAEIVRYYQFLKRHNDVYRGDVAAGEVLLLFPRSRVHEGDLAAVEAFKKRGRELLDQHVCFDVLPDDMLTPDLQKTYLQVIEADKAHALTSELSRIEAPTTVRASLSRSTQPNRLYLHLVNYNRTEPEVQRSPGGGIADEKPLATPEVACEVNVPAAWKQVQARLLTPEKDEPVELKVSLKEGRAHVRVPSVVVYGVVEFSGK